MLLAVCISVGESMPGAKLAYKEGFVLLQKGKRVLAKILIVASLSLHFFSVLNMPTVAEAPVVKVPQPKKSRKQSKGEKLLVLRKKIAIFKRRARIHESIKIQSKHKADGYLARFKKTNDRKLKVRLIKARNKALHSAHVHTTKMNYYLSRLKHASSRFDFYLGAKHVMVGRASWYGGGHRNRALVAAMRGFRGRKVKVVNLVNHKSVVIKVDDYGPQKWTGRVIDLSRASFARIASTSQGVIPKVKLYVY